MVNHGIAAGSFVEQGTLLFQVNVFQSARAHSFPVPPIVRTLCPHKVVSDVLHAVLSKAQPVCWCRHPKVPQKLSHRLTAPRATGKTLPKLRTRSEVLEAILPAKTVAFASGMEHRAPIGGGHGRIPGAHFIKQNTERPKIDFFSIRKTARRIQHLWRHCVQGATKRLALAVAAFQLLCKAEVNNFYVAFLVHNDVASFQISVNDILGVHVFQGHEDFGSNDKHAPQVVPDIRMARKFVQGRSRLDQFQQKVQTVFVLERPVKVHHKWTVCCSLEGFLFRKYMAYRVLVRSCACSVNAFERVAIVFVSCKLANPKLASSQHRFKNV